MAKKEIDWEAVEADYRIGRDSLRKIASKYSISEGAIRKRATEKNWERDLQGKINQRAEVIMQREMAKQRPDERDIVEANALLVSEVGLSHKILATKAREKGTDLLNQFDLQDENCDLKDKTRIYKDLVASLESVIKLERLAFGLDKTETIPAEQQNLQVSFVQPVKIEEIIVNE